MKVLYITGDGYAAMNVEQEIGIDKAVQMTHENGGRLQLDEEEYFADLRLLEFGNIDPKFVSWVKNEIQDYDMSKETNFYLIGEDELK